MSAFSLPIPPAHLAVHLHWPTERSATTSEDRTQKPEGQNLSVPARIIAPAATQPLQHLRDFLILISPMLPRRCIDVAEIMAIADPDANLIAGPNRHQKKAAELRTRSTLLGKTFRQVRTDRFARATQLLGKAALLARRKQQARSMHLQRDPIGPLEHLQILEGSDRLRPLHFAFSDFLVSGI